MFRVVFTPTLCRWVKRIQARSLLFFKCLSILIEATLLYACNCASYDSYYVLSLGAWEINSNKKKERSTQKQQWNRVDVLRLEAAEPKQPQQGRHFRILSDSSYDFRSPTIYRSQYPAVAVFSPIVLVPWNDDDYRSLGSLANAGDKAHSAGVTTATCAAKCIIAEQRK